MNDHTTPTQRAGLRDEIAAVLARFGDVDQHAMADAVLPVLYREWPWLRAEAEDAAPADQTALVRACATFVRDTYSGEWADDAAATLETDADKIERGEPCSLLRLAAVLPTPPGRRAVLLEGAAAIDATFTGPNTDRYARYAADLLRRMADETAATETQAATGSAPGERPTTSCRTFVSGGAVWCCEEGETDCLCVCHEPVAGARQDGAQR